MIKVKFNIEPDLKESDKPLISLNITHLYPGEVEGIISINAVNEADIEAGKAIFDGLLHPIIEYELDQLMVKLHMIDTLLMQKAGEGKDVKEAVKDLRPPFKEGENSLYHMDGKNSEDWPDLPPEGSIWFPSPVKVQSSRETV